VAGFVFTGAVSTWDQLALCASRETRKRETEYFYRQRVIFLESSDAARTHVINPTLTASSITLSQSLSKGNFT